MIILLNRLPIPNLKHYCLISFSLLLIVVIYGNKLLYDFKIRMDKISTIHLNINNDDNTNTNNNYNNKILNNYNNHINNVNNVYLNKLNKKLVDENFDISSSSSSSNNGGVEDLINKFSKSAEESAEDMMINNDPSVAAAVAALNDDINFSREILLNGYLYTTYKAITNEPWCIWVLINFSYCCLILFSKIIQVIIFGKLRALENQHIKDQFWNFIFLKFIFIFGVLNLENINEVTMWCVWFSIIGFLSIHSQICKDRFEFLSFSASTPLRNHVKVFTLLILIQIFCVCLVVASFAYYRPSSFSMNLFMFADSISLTLRTLYVITRYVLHLIDIYNLVELTNKGTLTYYIDLVFEISVIFIDLLHYLHMLIYGNFYLSMASLVICMELKRLFFEFKKRLKRHSNYLRVIEKMEKRFPWATQEEMIESDKCAVCWEKLEKARRLPCSHIFHHNCLRSWLEQDTSCPKCRKSLQDEKENQQTQNVRSNIVIDQNQLAPGGAVPMQGQQGANDRQNRLDAGAAGVVGPQYVQRNLFQFNGSRYISWLPSFSLQVTNGANVLPSLLRASRANLDPQRLADMTQQVRQLFPNIPVDMIQHDLRITHSVEMTIENILEDRLNNNYNNLNNANGNNNNINFNNGGNNPASNNVIGARANRTNLLNDDSDLNDETSSNEDEEDDFTSEEDMNNVDNINSGINSNNNGNTSNSQNTLRHRNTLFSNLLGGFNSSNSSTSRNSSEHQLRTNDEANQPQGLPGSAESTTSNANDDSAIFAKYSTSSSLSENANSLMERKRDLILNSKKRFLQKLSSNQSKENETSSQPNDSNSQAPN